MVHVQPDGWDAPFVGSPFANAPVSLSRNAPILGRPQSQGGARRVV